MVDYYQTWQFLDPKSVINTHLDADAVHHCVLRYFIGTSG